jgi:intracellular septation protein
VWATFFLAMGVLNLYVAYNFGLDFWIKFKVFGLMAITMVFIFTQVFWIASKMETPEEDGSEEQD